MRLVKSISAKVAVASLVAGAWVTVASAALEVGGQSVNALLPKDQNVSISQVVNNAINVGLAIIGLLAVAYLIYGGLLYITAGGDAEKAGKGRTAITNSIIGIVIVLAALIIYNGVGNTFNNSELQ